MLLNLHLLRLELDPGADGGGDGEGDGGDRGSNVEYKYLRE
jgi:hypothetical protein